MAGPPNVKRILNGAMRAAVLDLECELAKLRDETLGLDGDLVEAIAADNPNRDKVAEKGIELDHALMAVLVGVKDTAARHRADYADLRKALELG